MPTGEAFHRGDSSLNPVMGSYVELVPFIFPDVGPCCFFGCLERWDCMQEAGSGFQSGWMCCVSVQGVPGIGLLCSPLVFGDDGSYDVGGGMPARARRGTELALSLCIP